ncbi:cyclic nucleotide-gated ion channel 1-like isoform X2 [Argentina anserina]|uniref:cyclic nucleotide-gated ion channel 1-like isoform X2 n=1 Tax=Argentina anserina TaxID=57926 RepID=UPI00217622F0|nr:cyclic nucleotide-gated ion channel 1-like isoform X2 [Potentilla anserina]
MRVSDESGLALHEIDIPDEVVSSKNDGGHGSPKTSWRTNFLNCLRILLQPTRLTREWKYTFMISCSFALLLDPLYCYIPVINDDDSNMCYSLNPKLVATFLALRSAVDLFYAMDAIKHLRRFCNRKNSSDSQHSSTKQMLFLLLESIFLAIPIPQAIIITGKYSSVGSSIPLLFFYVIQFTLRGHATYMLIKDLEAKSETGGWIRPIRYVLEILPFIITSHLFGAVWYVLSLDREIRCWVSSCEQVNGCRESKTGYYFRCSTLADFSLKVNYNVSKIREACPTNPADPTLFDFGIYLYGIQTRITRSTNLPLKCWQSFWWSLRNLSSFGSNLQTSFNAVEISFSVLISLCGMSLFLVYLNTIASRNQSSRRRQEAERQAEVKAKHEARVEAQQKMILMTPYVDMWLKRNSLSDFQCFKEMITRALEKHLVEKKDVNMNNFLSILPALHKRTIQLAILTKVPVFTSISQEILKALSEHLELVIYAEGSCIVQQGEPLEMLFFITQGIAWTYTTSSCTNIDESASGGSLKITCLEKGDIYGGELLSWAKFKSFSDFPISTKTLKCQTKLEVFGIRANYLKSVFSKFWWHHRKEHPDSEHVQHLAALSLQSKWRQCSTRVLMPASNN